VSLLLAGLIALPDIKAQVPATPESLETVLAQATDGATPHAPDTDYNDAEIIEASSQALKPAAPKFELSQSNVVTSATSATNSLEPLPDVPKPLKKTLLQRSLEIAELEARLDEQRRLFVKRPWIKRLDDSILSPFAETAYLYSWHRKIEEIGQLNFPAEASRNGLYGSLRLQVNILPDGGLKEVIVLKSSGHLVLDQAAIDIVKLAAPFAPFSDELRRTADEVEIIKTWNFRKKRPKVSQ
jgi:periplasmic protein TonB